MTYPVSLSNILDMKQFIVIETLGSMTMFFIVAAILIFWYCQKNNVPIFVTLFLFFIFCGMFSVFFLKIWQTILILIVAIISLTIVRLLARN